MVKFQFTALLFVFIALVTCVPPQYLYRGDARSPDEIKHDGGFKSWAMLHRLTPDYDLDRHVNLPEGAGYQAKNDGYISTSSSYEVAKRFTNQDGSGGKGWLYKILTPPGAVDVVRALGRENCPALEREWVVRDFIHWYDVVSYAEFDAVKIVKDEQNNTDFIPPPNGQRANAATNGHAGPPAHMKKRDSRSVSCAQQLSSVLKVNNPQKMSLAKQPLPKKAGSNTLNPKKVAPK